MNTDAYLHQIPLRYGALTISLPRRLSTGDLKVLDAMWAAVRVYASEVADRFIVVTSLSSKEEFETDFRETTASLLRRLDEAKKKPAKNASEILSITLALQMHCA